MRAFVVQQPGRYAVAELPEPLPGPDEVLIAPAAVGICGADLTLLDGRRAAGYRKYPLVPGHEWAGYVVGVGAGVEGIDTGQPVVAEGIRGCGQCRRCQEGRDNLCTGPYAETGFTHAGALAERLVVPADLVHLLPTNQPIESAALIEPAARIATGLLDVGMPPAGSRLAVVGDGPIGLLALLLLKLTNPAELVLLGRRPDRVAVATGCGATETQLAAHGTEPELTGRFDLVIEASNQPSGADTALRLARRGGTVLLLGVSGQGLASLDADVISVGQLRVQGAFAATPDAWRWTIDLYWQGLFEPAPLITHRFSLGRTSEALAVLGAPRSPAIKAIIHPNGEAGLHPPIPAGGRGRR